MGRGRGADQRAGSANHRGSRGSDAHPGAGPANQHAYQEQRPEHGPDPDTSAPGDATSGTRHGARVPYGQRESALDPAVTASNRRGSNSRATPVGSGRVYHINMKFAVLLACATAFAQTPPPKARLKLRPKKRLPKEPDTAPVRRRRSGRSKRSSSKATSLHARPGARCHGTKARTARRQAGIRRGPRPADRERRL